MKRFVLPLVLCAVALVGCGTDGTTTVGSTGLTPGASGTTPTVGSTGLTPGASGTTPTVGPQTGTTPTPTPAVDEANGNPQARDGDRQALAAAIDLWQRTGFDAYDYTFQRVCFCTPEYIGPYRASVAGGDVVAATLDGVDLFDVEVLDIDAYGDLVLTVDEVFAEIERAIDEADSYHVEYHADLGYPTAVSIDWQANLADEEDGYVLSDLVPRAATAGCSTAGVDIRLTPQPELPDAVAQRRQAIFDAAVACDIEALAAETNPAGFNASFGGGAPADVWTAAEAGGRPVLLDLVRLLNLNHAQTGSGADTVYVWPSAFVDLRAADGTGLDPADYQALLGIYPLDELEQMFEGLGGYVGYRIGIDAAGNWNFFVAGD